MFILKIKNGTAILSINTISWYVCTNIKYMILTQYASLFVHCSITHINHGMVLTQISKKKKRPNKENVINAYNGVLFALQK